MKNEKKLQNQHKIKNVKNEIKNFLQLEDKDLMQAPNQLFEER